MSTVKKRILEYADNKGFKKSKFPEKIGMSYSNFRGKSLNSALNSDAIAEITSIFPNIDLHWLITGEKKLEEEAKNLVMEDPYNYGENYKAKYLEVLEENRELSKKVIKLLESNDSFKKHNKQISN